MKQITKEDLVLINNLSSRNFKGFTLISNSNEYERGQLNEIKSKLESIANYFTSKYNLTYGPFLTSVSPERNPITRGNKLHHVWSSLFKGYSNKQHAAQISFVIDTQIPCLNVGFYFGSASSRNLDKTKIIELEKLLTNLGIGLSNTIINNNEFRKRFHSLFDLGFTAYSNENNLFPDNWCNIIRTETKNSRITAKIYPNDFGVIENSTIDFYVSQVVFLMAAINTTILNPFVTPLTPEQWAKKAERNAQIGLEGELYILRYEINKLRGMGINREGYPKHVALESNHYGYDILSLDESENDIFIEVKTTTRKINDPNSKKFFISNNEYDVYSQNKQRYKLHRVYEVENNPSFDELDLDSLTKEHDGYTMTY